MQFIKEKLKLPQISPDNKQFYLYFAMPILLGILLVDGLGMDISNGCKTNRLVKVYTERRYRHSYKVDDYYAAIDICSILLAFYC